jgi:spermidine synthase
LTAVRDLAARPVEIVVFVAGATLLGVEIAASRVLAPYFGNSLFVWGALIGVVLAGLAVGYWVGGTLVDRLPKLELLLGVTTAGAVSVLAIPLLDEPVLRAIVSWDPGPRANPVIASVILFGPTSVLLAAVVPIAVRLRSSSVEDAGRTAGRLFALSTVGSIVGTFLTAFWLIPELGTDELLGLVAAALLATIALLALTQRLFPHFVLLIAACAGAVVVAFAVAPPSSGEQLEGVALQNWSPTYRIRGRLEPVDVPSGGTLVYRKDTEYHRLFVIDEGDTRHLRFGSSFQSAMELDDPYATSFAYTDYIDVGFAYHPSTRNVLIIGLGGGSAPKRIWRDFKDVEVQVVEIDPEVVRVARRFFALPDDPRLRVEVEDGRRFLAGDQRKWDLIAIDAYYSDAIPFHLTTREFVALVQERLAPGGVVIANIIGALRGPDSKLLRSIYRTYRSVFPTVAVHPVRDHSGWRPTGYVNQMIFAMDGALPRKSVLLERWRGIRARAPLAPDLTKPIRDRFDEPIPVRDVPTLTDDYAPTDALLVD